MNISLNIQTSSGWAGAKPGTLGPNYVGLQMKWNLDPKQPPPEWS